jgi:hypothetical protein
MPKFGFSQNFGNVLRFPVASSNECCGGEKTRRVRSSEYLFLREQWLIIGQLDRGTAWPPILRTGWWEA